MCHIELSLLSSLFHYFISFISLFFYHSHLYSFERSPLILTYATFIIIIHNNVYRNRNKYLQLLLLLQ